MTYEHQPQSYPLSSLPFEEIREKNLVYADKTDLI